MVGFRNGWFSHQLSSSLTTRWACLMENAFPRRVKKPLALKRRVISAQLCPLLRSDSARSPALRLLSFVRALACWMFLPLRLLSSVRFRGFPSLSPRFFFSARARRVRSAMISRSYRAMVAITPMVKVLASGISTQINSTPASRRVKTKETLRVSRSSLAMRRTAR